MIHNNEIIFINDKIHLKNLVILINVKIFHYNSIIFKNINFSKELIIFRNPN